MTSSRTARPAVARLTATACGGALIGDVNANVINYPDVPLRVAVAPKPNALLVTIDQTLKGVSLGKTKTVIDQFEHQVP